MGRAGARHGSAVLLFVTELATLSYRTIGMGGCTSREDPGVCITSGGDAHGQALWLIALLVLVFSLARRGRSRPAAVGVIVCGLIVLVIGVLLDRPDLDGLRGLDAKYTDVTAHTGAAFALELVGGVLAGAGGVGGAAGGFGPAGAAGARGVLRPAASRAAAAATPGGGGAGGWRVAEGAAGRRAVLAFRGGEAPVMVRSPRACPSLPLPREFVEPGRG